MSSCVKGAVCLSGNIQTQMGSKLCSVISRRPSSSCCFCLNPGNSKKNYTQLSVFENCPSNVSQTTHRSFVSSCISKDRGKLWSLTVKDLLNAGAPQRRHLKISLANHAMSMRLVVPKQGMLPKIDCSAGSLSWPRGCASAGLIFGLLVSYSGSEPIHAEGAQGDDDEEDDYGSSYVKLSRGKKVYTDYSVIGEDTLPAFHAVLRDH